jgi:NTE family protein
MVSQHYTGDINIFPSFRFYDPRKLAVRWSEKDMDFLISEGERCTWPKIEMIRNCVKISSKLEQILESLAGTGSPRHSRALRSLTG